MRSAVIVIDMLQEFLYGEPSQLLIPSENVRQLIENTSKLITKARHEGLPVIHVACLHEDDSPIFRSIPRHALRGSAGAEVVSELAPQEGDHLVRKITYDGFYETKLEALIRQLETEKLLLAGIQTDCCVHATGQGAIFRGHQAALVGECCDTADEERQRVGLKRFSALIGPVVTIDDLGQSS